MRLNALPAVCVGIVYRKSPNDRYSRILRLMRDLDDRYQPIPQLDRDPDDRYSTVGEVRDASIAIIRIVVMARDKPKMINWIVLAPGLSGIASKRIAKVCSPPD